MSNVQTYLSLVSKKLSGKVLGFGDIDSKIIDTLEKNDAVVEFTLLSGITGSYSGNGKNSGKKVLYKNVRKKFKKKKISTIICYYKDLDKYRYRFIADSVVLASDKIYLYIENNACDLERLKKQYERYNVYIEEEKCRGGIVLVISLSDKKYRKWKEKYYRIVDKLYDLYELIGDLFVS